MKKLVFFYTVLSASIASGQTLPDFRDYILSPLATQAAQEQAETKRKALTKLIAEATFYQSPWRVLGAVPTVKEFAPALEVLSGAPTIEQLEAFHRVLMGHIDAQARSRKELYLSELVISTSAKVTDDGVVFSVCQEKKARQWKAGAAGTFQRLTDGTC